MDNFCNQILNIYLRFWYHVFTWVSVRFNFAASSIRSCTLRYFWRSKLFSKVWSWWSEKAVRAFRCFFWKLWLFWDCPFKLVFLSPDSPSSTSSKKESKTIYQIFYARFFERNLTFQWWIYKGNQWCVSTAFSFETLWNCT